uniref:phosphomevalonate kinase n=1 Tax=Eleocharis dulcis TaxID=110284 RepID=A0A7G4WEX4_9POAL|nr:phosphomevalonate kinase [Eleocharis dulcis]
MEVVVSAPGKVLITGGYLVLDRPNSGIVLSTTARFYAIVRPIYDEIKPDSWAWGWTDVKVTSPQLSREASYKLSLKKCTLQCTSSRESTNPFVEQAVQYCVAACKVVITEKDKKDAFDKLLLQGLHITILGSNDFYSYRSQIEERGLPLTPEALTSLPPFSSITFNTGDVHSGPKPEVAKTGLGSSAAMTTSVVASLLHYLGAVSIPFPGNMYSENGNGINNSLDLVHAIAQSAHCIAQGKIGSGFDVSSAVYGSQKYVRFTPQVLSSTQDSSWKKLPEIVSDVLKQRWDHENKPFSLPPLLTLLLGEPGTGGSSTPSMVGSVRKWQNSDPTNSQEIWQKLADSNLLLESHLKNLNKYSHDHYDSYKNVITACSRLPWNKWVEMVSDQIGEMVVKSLLSTREAFLQIRYFLREMGKAAGVPIEPESQTQILDLTVEMEGVLFAGVPGAGGFDAVFAVILGDANHNPVISAWSSRGVLPLLVGEDPLGVRLENGDPRARDVSSAISTITIS